MKQCQNPNCMSYTRLEEFPDAYLRCPLCDEPLAQSAYKTGALNPEQYIEEDTAPNAPFNRQQVEYHPQDYIQRSYEIAYDDYGGEYDEAAAEPLRPLPGEQGRGIRTTLVALGAVALVAACLALGLSLSGRLAARTQTFGGAAATQTALANPYGDPYMRPAVNTPLPILPTIPLSGVGGMSDSGGRSGIGIATPVIPPSAPDPQSPSPFLEALMCARLEGGQPIGPTEAYRTTDPFNLAVRAEFGPQGVRSVFTRWYGPDDTLIYEMKRTYEQSGVYYAGFTLGKDTPWAAGSYRVDIYTNDSLQPVGSVSFAVVE